MRTIKKLLLLSIVGAAMLVPASSQATGCPGAPFGPHGHVGVVCTVDGFGTYGAEWDASVNPPLGRCYTSGVGACPIRHLWIWVGSPNNPLHIGCTSVGFAGDAVQVSANGTGVRVNTNLTTGYSPGGC